MKNKGFIGLETLIITGLAALIAIGSSAYFVNKNKSEEVSFGTAYSVAAKQTKLGGSGVSATATTINLVDLETPNGDAVTMSNFGDIGYGTIEPGRTNKEFVSFTGITQNADGTASLTGVTRGLDFVSPYTASTSLRKAHPGGSTFVISNPPQLYDTLISKVNNSFVTGTLTFSPSAAPRYSTNPDFTGSSTTLIPDINYVNNVATSGAPDAGFAVKGIIEIATSSELYTGTGSGDTTAQLVPASGAFNGTSSARNIVPVTKSNGKLDQGFLDLTEGFTFGGGVTSTATTTLAGTNNLTGTTTLSGSTTVSGSSFNINSTTTANSPVTFATTTTFSSQVVGITPIIGTSTFSVVTSATTTDTTITTGFLPGIIKIYFFNQGHDKATESNVYKAESGFVVVASSTKPIIVCYNGSGNTGGDNQSPSAIAARGCQGSGTAGAAFSSAGTNDPGVGTGNIYSTLSIPSITNTGFTIRRTTTIGASNSNNARAEISYEVYR